MTDDAPIVPVPAPWKLKATVYLVNYWTSAGELPDFAYSPLESSSPYADPAASGKHRGGLSQFQIIRYSDSPVGPYDELIVCPGFFEYQTLERGKLKTKRALRITRIYVSQKYTCWNGRKNWNIPKHLARFEFNDAPDGSTSVKVYPHDTTDDPTEKLPNQEPFFQAKVQPIRWVPSFPLSLGWLKYTGIDISLVQPPLPEGRGSLGELPGTDRWCKIMPAESSRRASLTWVDMNQADEKGVLHAKHQNFWPGLKQWQFGVKLEDCEVDFGHGIYWDPPPTKL
ncbi:hypothetical protein BX600DRAFT_508290 [Xylariales sp. PMI_506]|nr:hypothetical protein BX600DRAFT_508290 [Xylariales sp. PMI_506]